MLRVALAVLLAGIVGCGDPGSAPLPAGPDQVPAGPARAASLAGVECVPRPDAMAGDAAGGRFVFGVVDTHATRVAYLPPGGRPAAPLERFDLAAARTWWAFGGFVPGPPGGVVVAYDAAGRELRRSLPVH